jgi:hypothetical protein
MQETDLHYPPDACPFCGIAAAYPVKDSGLWNKKEELQDAVPNEEECNVEKTSPSSFLVMRTRDVVAFLDILPMTGGKLKAFVMFATRGARGIGQGTGNVAVREAIDVAICLS